MAARSHRLAVILHRKPLGPKSTATSPPKIANYELGRQKPPPSVSI